MPSWDPDLYQRYKTYRDRPALDLLLQIPTDLDPKVVWDLGCGPGEQAALLARRHKPAKVYGLDSSPQMLEAARRREEGVTWVMGDINRFDPPEPADLIYTNAALQWTPDHETLFPYLAGKLAPEGVFACQMPVTFDQPWHIVLRDLADEPQWRLRMAGVRGATPVAPAAAYFDWLSPICAEIDIWTTTYLHVLEGEDPIVEWMSGTGMRPYLDLLNDPEERAVFVGAYRDRIKQIMPARPDGRTLFPFPRLFIIARR